MSEVGYTTGTWLAMAGRHTWLLVDMAADADLISRCWSLVRDDAELEQILGMILHEGFRTIRNFALVRHHGEAWRCCVRGDATVTADGATVTASGVATWMERDLGPAAGVVLAAGEPAAGGVRYPLVLGVVPAATVWVGAVSAAAQPEHRQAPAPVPVPDRPQETPADDSRVVESVNRYFGVAQVAPTAPEVEYFTELPDLAVPRMPSRTVSEEVPPAAPVAPTPSGFIDHIAWAEQVEAWVPARRNPVAARNPGDEDLDETMLRSHPIDTRQAEPDAGAVRAVRCPGGHLSADTASACRVCATPIPPQQAMTVPRPVLGVLRLSTGDEIALDRGVLLGRAPTAPVDGRQRTHLVRLTSEDKQISRNHVEIRLDGWEVLVVDLGTKNGTELHHPDGLREQLDAHTPTVLLPGARVVLDDQTHFTFEVCP